MVTFDHNHWTVDEVITDVLPENSPIAKQLLELAPNAMNSEVSMGSIWQKIPKTIRKDIQTIYAEPLQNLTF